MVQAQCSTGGGTSPTSADVFAQGFVSSGGARRGASDAGTQRVLLINKKSTPQSVTLPGANGGTMQVVDLASGDGPPRSSALTSDTIALQPFATAVVQLPAAA